MVTGNIAATDRPDDPREGAVIVQGKPQEEVECVSLFPEIPDRTVKIGAGLPVPLRDSLIKLLKENASVFAWSYADMPGISTKIISHKLGIDPAYRPVRQKRRIGDQERYEAMKVEVDKLLSIGFIREVQYPWWLANLVLVKKPNGKWRMCIDFTDLNKACPKDSFPLPRIEQLVNSTAGHEALSFMDAYSGYNQIKLDPEDQEHTSFMTDQGCTATMSCLLG